jgi:outer membrane immunogenic protein
MKKLLVAASAVAVFYGAPALAAPPPVFNWTGFYVGANGGYGWSAGSSNLTVSDAVVGSGVIPVTSSFDANSGFGGVQIGYNLQRDDGRVVFGIEADIQSGIRGKGTASTPGDSGIDDSIDGTARSGLDWFGTARGRMGFTFDRSLIYFTGGFAFGGVNDRLTVSELSEGALLKSTVTRSRTTTGFVLGGGLEYVLGPAWSLKGEYQYMNLGTSTLSVKDTTETFDRPTANARFDHNYHTIRLGLNYKFGSL